jgi:hypothetical protein
MIEQLDLFVHDELNGLDVRSRHPRVWQHLQVCADCRAEHDSLLDLLVAEAQGLLKPLPPRSSTLQRPSIFQPWRTVIENLPGQPRPALVFVFAPVYLQQSLRPAVGATRRDQAASGRETLLLSYYGALGAGEVMVQIYGRPWSAGSSDYRLALVAVSEPMPGAAVLTWGDQTWTFQLGPDGDAEFGPVSLAPLANAPVDSTAFSLRLLP